jgi:hypothetical protein
MNIALKLSRYHYATAVFWQAAEEWRGTYTVLKRPRGFGGLKIRMINPNQEGEKGQHELPFFTVDL